MYRSTILMSLVLFISMGSGLAQTQPTIEFDSDPDPIGRFECEDRLNQAIVITGSYLNSSNTEPTDGLNGNADDDEPTDPWNLRLYFNAGASDCLNELNPTLCVPLSADGLCGCLAEVTNSPTTLTYNLPLGGIPGLAETLCSQDLDIGFTIESVDAEDFALIEDSEVIELKIVHTLPSAPQGKPRVSPKEEALEISLSEAAPTTVVSHEVCVRPRINNEDEPPEVDLETATSNSDLRNGFDDDVCLSTTSLKSGGSYRYQNLSNNSPYEIVVAAVDEAGNRSLNSETAIETPQELLDFAEVYRDRLKKSDDGEFHPGELGGCTTGPTKNSGPAALLLMAGFLLIRLRRNN